MKNHITAGAVTFFVCAFLFVRSPALTDGYILCGAYSGRSTVLIDKNGECIHTWNHDKLQDTLNGYSCYLLENGNLLRTAQVVASKKLAGAMPWQGAINEVDPSGNIVWRYVLSNDTFTLHHDIKLLPNGNVLATSFMVQTKAQMTAAGVDTNLLRSGGNGKFMLSEKIIEIRPRRPEGGDIVWQWVMFDHVVAREKAAAHPECISGAIVGGLYNLTQWVHLNGLDYDSSSDLIVFSSRVFSELYVIDHGTTMLEASGHTGGARGKGGDILYRWGRPANYGTSGGATIDCLHCPTWIPPGSPGAGHIMFFHNNTMAAQSEVIEIAPPFENGNFQNSPGQAFGPQEPAWKFAPKDSFNSPFMSSAMRMPSGNTLAHEAYPQGNIMDTSANSILREITPDKKIVWKYTLRIRSGLEASLMGEGAKQWYNTAKIMYYPGNFAGVANLLTRRNGIQTGSKSSVEMKRPPAVNRDRKDGLIDFMNVAGSAIRIFSLQGREIASAFPETGRFTLSSPRLRPGIFLIKFDSRVTGSVMELPVIP